MAGNANSGRRQEKPFRDALMLAIKEREGDERGLRKIANNLLDLAEKSDVNALAAIREFADRIDGRPPQALVGGDEDDNPIKLLHQIERLIVDTANPDSPDIQAATTTEPV